MQACTCDSVPQLQDQIPSRAEAGPRTTAQLQQAVRAEETARSRLLESKVNTRLEPVVKGPS